MQKLFSIFSILFLHLFFCTVFAQSTKDNTIDSTKKITDTSKKAAKPFNPKTATIRSAILPGWGQAYNKKYWKIPIIYAALGTTTYLFFYNLNTYKSLKQSYIYKTDTIPGNDALIPPEFQNLNANSLRIYRNEYRKNVDYSVLFFFIFWGLNVVDATVDAHLKAFDVSDNLSLQIKPGYSPLANTNGISFVFDIHSKNKGAK
jgi:hypothetical protein